MTMTAPDSDVAPTDVIGRLTDALGDLSPQVRQAAVYVLDNPGEIAVTSMRGIAEAAEVKPNTLVRMARAVGFDGYEDFREPFRQQAADGSPSFPDRARFLQSINEGGRHGSLLADMAAPTFDPDRFANVRQNMIRGLKNAVAQRPSWVSCPSASARSPASRSMQTQ